MKNIKNKKAYFDYEIIEKYEAGIELFGFEVKSIKKGGISLAGSFGIIKNGEVFLLNAFVAPYQPQNTPQKYNPLRTRKLLLHKKEIESLIGKSKQKRLTIVPFSVYTKRGFVKICIVLAKSKKKKDKREKIKERDINREVEREIKGDL